MKQKAVSGKLLLVDLEGVCRLSVRFSKYSEQNVPFNALLLQRRLQNRTTRKIMPHPVAHAPKLLGVETSSSSGRSWICKLPSTICITHVRNSVML